MAPSATQSPAGDVEVLRARKTPLYLNVYYHESILGKNVEKKSPRVQKSDETARAVKQSSRIMDRKIATQHVDSRAAKGNTAMRSKLDTAAKTKVGADSERTNLGKRPHSKMTESGDKMEPASRAPRACGPAQTPPGKSKDHDKYCHFCQHVKVSMLACETQYCSHRFCTYCLTVHLGDDVDPSTSVAWRNGQWSCPTCRSDCCCSSGECSRNHRHCKAFRYRCRRANAASLRTNAAQALVSLAGCATPTGAGKPSAKVARAAAAATAGAAAAGLAGVSRVVGGGVGVVKAEEEEMKVEEEAVKHEDVAQSGGAIEGVEEGEAGPDRMEGLVMAAMERGEAKDAETRVPAADGEAKEENTEVGAKEEEGGRTTGEEEEVALSVLLGLSAGVVEVGGGEDGERRGAGKCGAMEELEEGGPLLGCPLQDSSAPSTPPRGGGEEGVPA